ncbi:MAG: hypothetical protein OEY30_03335 [Candidatus Bathyarchaeota archaeon]|nr:hypothetical protein [Candidatus Bathyarchaeota archaeon]
MVKPYRGQNGRRSQVEAVSELSPKQFEGIHWRSCIKKISDNKVAMGLEWVKEEGKFERCGETIAVKEP